MLAFVLQGAMATFCCAQVLSPFNERNEGHNYVAFDFALKLPDYAAHLAWSPDGRFLALFHFKLGHVRLVDVKQKKLIDQIAIEKAGLYGLGQAMTWSPDGKYIAVTQGTPVNAIRLVSVADFKEVGNWKGTDECWVRNSLAFAPDSRSLWTTCQAKGVKPSTSTNTLVALKFSLPEFDKNDELTLQAPIPEKPTIFRAGHFQTVERGLLLTWIAGSYTGKQVETGRHFIREFALGVRLADKAVAFPGFELERDESSGAHRYSEAALLKRDGRYVIIRLSGSRGTRPGIPVNNALDRALETYDTETGQRVRAFAGEAMAEHCSPTDAEFLPRTNLLVASFGCGKSTDGGLVVFDPIAGALIQRSFAVNTSKVSASKSGNSVAVSAPSALLFYKIE